MNELEKAQLEEIHRKRESDIVGGTIILVGYLMFAILGVAILIIEALT